MTSKIKVTVRPPSPNNTKVLIALAYKGIDAEVIAVEGGDPETIAALVELSGQPLTPIIEHGSTVLFDSSAILRYLDANFDGPRLFSADREEHKAIEQWEAFHRNELGGAIGPVFGAFFGGASAPELESCIARANQSLASCSAQVEEQLKTQAALGSEWLVGKTMTAADILVVCFLSFAAFPPGMESNNPLWLWFGERLTLPEGRDLCRAHIARVLAYLPLPATA